jgi:hypothetical protein
MSDQHVFMDFFITGNFLEIGRQFKGTPFGGAGRFWPLVLQDFRPLFSLGLNESTIITGIFVHNAVKLLMMLTFLWLGVRRLASSFSATCICFLFLLFTRHLFWMFSNTQGMESTVMALWAVWFYLYVRAGERDKAIFYILAALVAGTAFYLKETAFTLFVPSSLILLCLNFKRLTFKSRLYHFCILLQVFVFLGLYYWCMYRISSVFYNEGRTLLSRWDIMFFYYKTNWFIIPAVLVLVWRGLNFIRRREKSVAIVDVLLINALAFVAAFVILKLVAGYYILPAAPALITGLFLQAREVFSRYRADLPRVTVIGVLALLCALGFVFLPEQYRQNFRNDANALRNDRRNTQETLTTLLTMKEADYTFITYLPPQPYFSSNTFMWHQILWNYSVWHRFIRFYSRDYDFNIINISDATWPGEEPLPRGAWLISPDPRLVEHAFQRPDAKLLLLQIPGDRSYFYDVDINKTYTRSIPYFNLYFSTPPPVRPEDWTGKIDIRRLEVNTYVFISGLSVVEDWGRWVDGSRTTITILLPDFLHGKAINITLPLIHVFREQRVLTSLNGRLLPELILDKPETLTFIATEAETASGGITLVFDLPDAQSPASMGSPDTRMLSIGFKELIIELLP